MKKIIFLRSNPVSPDSRVEKEVNSLLKNGFQVKVIGWDREKNYKGREEKLELFESNTTIVRRGIKASYGDGMKNIIPFLKFQIFLFQWLIKNKREYEIIHACDFDTAFIAYLSTKITKKKIIFDVFDYLSTDAKKFPATLIKKIEDSLLTNSDAVIICTEQRKMQIKDSKPKKTTIIHNTPQVQSNLNPVEHDKIRIAYVGVLQEFRLIEEMVKVISRHSEVELHIGGFGKLEPMIKNMAENYENIIYYGKISYNETLNLENSCDLMTAIYDPKIGNHYYAAPNKFYEALMLGKPLIMVKNTGMSQIVEKYDIGINIDYNESSFEEGLLKLISRKNEWNKINLKMKNLYKEYYAWDVMEKRLIELYSNI